jgi:single-strand DNA-binding protein
MSVNKVILVGNVGKDPEVRYLDKNVAVANFTLATTERGYKTASGIEVPERTEWHNIVAWRGLADLSEKYIKKGSQLYIEGKLQTRSWEKDGIKRYTTEIVADVIQLLGRRADGQESHAAAPSQATATVQPPFDAPAGAPDDDLPF